MSKIDASMTTDGLDGSVDSVAAAGAPTLVAIVFTAFHRAFAGFAAPFTRRLQAARTARRRTPLTSSRTHSG